MKMKYSNVLFLLSLMLSTSCAMKSSISPDLSNIARNDQWMLLNRSVHVTDDAQFSGVQFDAQAEMGVAWFKTVNFSNGTIEVDLKGKEQKDRSYLGVAFRGNNEKAYEAIYFRPFNFRAADELHKSHAIQYIAEPGFPWEKLRKQFPGKYESAVPASIDPNDYFHVKIVLDNSRIQVYLDDSSKPVMDIDSLIPVKEGWVGLWMGKNADGTFKNLKITPG